MAFPQSKRIKCPVCGKRVLLSPNGLLRRHRGQPENKPGHGLVLGAHCIGGGQVFAEMFEKLCRGEDPLKTFFSRHSSTPPRQEAVVLVDVPLPSTASKMDQMLAEAERRVKKDVDLVELFWLRLKKRRVCKAKREEDSILITRAGFEAALDDMVAMR